MENIFNDKPIQWGFRGDPYMWAELKEYFSKINDDIEPEKFNVLLDKKFIDIIESGEKLTSINSIWIKKYPQSGMSGGAISLGWWKETGLPLLKSRYAELKNQMYRQRKRKPIKTGISSGPLAIM